MVEICVDTGILDKKSYALYLKDSQLPTPSDIRKGEKKEILIYVAHKKLCNVWKPSTFPMIFPPNAWSLSETKAIDGGYLINKETFNSLASGKLYNSNKRNNFQLTFFQKGLDNINFLSGTAYKINDLVLNSFLKNKEGFLKAGLLSDQTFLTIDPVKFGTKIANFFETHQEKWSKNNDIDFDILKKCLKPKPPLFYDFATKHAASFLKGSLKDKEKDHLKDEELNAQLIETEEAASKRKEWKKKREEWENKRKEWENQDKKQKKLASQIDDKYKSDIQKWKENSKQRKKLEKKLQKPETNLQQREEDLKKYEKLKINESKKPKKEKKPKKIKKLASITNSNFEQKRFELISDIKGCVSKSHREERTIDIAILYQGQIIYFPAIFDGRGRNYRSDEFHVQGDKFTRMLLAFADELELKDSLLPKYYTYNAYHFYKFQTPKLAHIWFIENLKKIMDINNFHKHFDCDQLENKWAAYSCSIELNEYQKCKEEKKPFYSQMIYYQDAHASAFQIYSILTFDSVLSSICGIHPPTKSFLEKVVKENFYGISQSLRETFFSEKYYYLFYNLVLEMVKETNNFSEIDRGLVKDLIMPLGYGLTLARQKQIIKDKTPSLTTDQQSKLYQDFALTTKKVLEKVLILYNFLRYLGHICAYENLSINTDFSKFLHFSHKYVKTKKVSVKLWNNKNRRTFNHNFSTEESKPTKNKSSTPANIIHHIDGTIAMFCIENFSAKAKNNAFFMNHDCLYTTLNHVDIVNNVYNEAVFKVMDNDPSLIIKKNFKTNFFRIIQKNYERTPDKINEMIQDIEARSKPLKDILPESFKEDILLTKQEKRKKIKRLTLFCELYQKYLELVPEDNEKTNFCQKILRSMYALR